MFGWAKRASARASSRNRSSPHRKIGFVLGRNDGDPPVDAAHRERLGEVLLDRDALVQILVDGRVSDAEPARTEIPFDAVLAEFKTGWQRDEISGCL